MIAGNLFGIGRAAMKRGEAHAARSISSSSALAFSYLASVIVLPASISESLAPLPSKRSDKVEGARPVFLARA